LADDLTSGVKAGIDAARGATTSVDGVPPSVLNTARNIALQTGGNEAAVSSFMQQQGYPQHAGEWCGDFVAAVVHASGGTPPPNSAAAGAWASYGSPRQGGPQPGDIAVMRGADNKTGYPYTHVTFVDSVNPDGTFVGLGGNQGGGHLKRSTFSVAGFDFRNPQGGGAAPPSGGVPGAAAPIQTAQTPQTAAPPSMSSMLGQALAGIASPPSGGGGGMNNAALAQAAPPAPGPQMAFRAAADDAAQASNLTAGGPPGSGAIGQPETGAAGMTGLLGLMADPTAQSQIQLPTDVPMTGMSGLLYSGGAGLGVRRPAVTRLT
jgi:hypothetical protein